MNSVMNIQVRVLARQAQAQLAQLQRQVGALGAANGLAAGSAAGIGNAGQPALRKWGSQLQWAGRQLQYNFTLPIVAASALATKFALDNEKAMTRIQKVYGDASTSTATMRSETDALGKSFRVLSDYFGVAQKDVLNIAADWAAAGVSGAALAKVTKITLETMILGEMNAADATRALIQIQAQYGQSTTELSKTISILNMVENQTGTSMEDLIVALSRSAGTARTAGVDIRHLAAMTAALVPAAGTAANAGNALKTIFSRILAPTKQAADLMKIVGINTDSAGWASLNAEQRLQALGKAFEGSTHSQKALLTTTVAGRYQLNRFDVLLRALTNSNSYYYKALRATSSQTANYKQEQRELNQVLSSNPQKFKQLGVILQNMAAEVITPLIPLILALANTIKSALGWFTNLNPAVQKLIGTGLLLLAVMGPILRYIGAISLALSLLKPLFIGIAKFLILPFKGLLSILGGTLKGVAWFGLGVLRVFAAIGGFVGGTFLTIFGTSFGRLVAMFSAAFSTIKIIAIGSMRVIAAGVVSLWTIMLRNMAVAMAGASGLIGGLFSKMLVGLGALMVTRGQALIRLFTLMGLGMMKVWALVMAFLGRITFTGIIFGAFKGLKTGVIFLIQGMARGVIAVLTALGEGILAALTSPFGLAILAVLILASTFRDKLKGIWNRVVDEVKSIPKGFFAAFAPVVTFFQDIVKYIVKAFDALPQGVKNALDAVAKIVYKAAMEVYKLFSYLNPFAHHSPSLVENVTTGMNVVRNEHSKTSKSAQEHTSTIASAHKQITNTISSANSSTSTSGVSSQAAGVGAVDAMIKRATIDIAKFKAAAKGMIPSEWADQIKAVRDQFPTLLPMFMKLIDEYNKLNRVAAVQQAAVDRQQATVNIWKARLDAANASLDTQNKTLDKLQKQLDVTQAAYDAAQSSMDSFASAPIKGMQKFSDEIFDNGIAQKKLQLQMAQWEQQNGSLDSLNNKFSTLNGEISALQGEASALRAKGAGSDILGPIQQQITALQSQASAVQATIKNSPVSDLQNQLDALQKQGDILQLQNDITFDPLVHQIQNLANTTKELSYADIIKGIQDAKDKMASLTPTLNTQTAAVAAQQKAVDLATTARDNLQDRYDSESKKLDVLQAAYSKTADAIGAIKDQLDAVSSAATTAASALSKAGGSDISKQFSAAGKGDFPEFGGKNPLGKEGGVADINAFTAQQQKDLAKQLGSFNMFGPLKDMWKKGWAWIVKYLGPIGHLLVVGVEAIFSGIGKAISSFTSGSGGSALGSFFAKTFGIIKSLFNDLANVFKLFWPDIKRVFFALGDMAKTLWRQLAPALLKLWNQLKPLFPILKLIAGVIAVALLFSLKLIISIITTALVPAFKLVVTVAGYIIRAIGDVIQIFTGVWNFFQDLFTGKWGKLWGDVQTVFGGAWDFIVATFTGAWNVIKGIFDTIHALIKGFVNGIVEFFKWLYDVLVGHSIIPDMMKAILGWFQWLIAPAKVAFQLLWTGIKFIWNNVAVPIFNGVKVAIEFIPKVIGGIVGGAKAAFGAVWAGLQWVWDHSGGPLIHGIQDVFNKVAGWISAISGPVSKAFQTVWDGLKAVWNTVKSDVFQPVLNGFRDIVNGFISAINWLISGINKVSGFLHLGIHIDNLGQWGGIKLAAGGQVPYGSEHKGMKTNGPRAIVGEGRKGYPEYVIPTDPRYRNRAKALWGAAGKDIAMLAMGGRIPMLSQGGSGDTGGSRTINLPGGEHSGSGKQTFPYSGSRGNITDSMVDDDRQASVNWIVNKLESEKNWAEKAGDSIEGLAKAVGSFVVRNGLKAIFWPIKTGVDKLMDHVPVEFVSKMGKGVTQSVWNKIDSIGRSKDKYKNPDYGNGYKVDRFAPVAIESAWRVNGGGISSVFQSLNIVPDILRRLSKESGGNPNAINLWDSNAAAGIPSKGIMQVIDPTFQAHRASDLANNIWDPRANMYAGLHYAKGRYGDIATGMNQPGGYKLGTANSRSGWSLLGENGPELVRLPYSSRVINNSASMKAVGAMAGRVAARIAAPAAGSTNASVAGPVTNNTTNNRTVNVTVAKVVLPNIRSADDAEELLANLEALGTGSL